MPTDDGHKSVIYFLARFGCYSIGVVYILIGVLAILSFLKLAGDNAAEARMIELVMEVPFGEVLLWLMVAGLAGYIIWRVYEAVTDPYEMGSGWLGLIKRTGVALSGTGYALIGFTAVQIILGNNNGSEEEFQLFIRDVFDWPAGRWLVAVAGLTTAGAGLVQFYYVSKRSYKQRLHMDEFSYGWETGVHVLAWIGYGARGVLLLVLGYFLCKAGLQGEPQEAGDTDSAFNFLGDGGSLFGGIAFLLVAGGTIAYGIFMFVYGRYYQFKKQGGN